MFPFILVYVCAWGLDGDIHQCYDTLFDSRQIIVCDQYDWGHAPLPWEWSRGTLILGNISSWNGRFETNYVINYEWGGFDILNSDPNEYAIAFNVGLSKGFQSSFDGYCWTWDTSHPEEAVRL